MKTAKIENLSILKNEIENEQQLNDIVNEGRIAAQVNNIQNPKLKFNNFQIESLGYYKEGFQLSWGVYGNNGVEYISKDRYLEILNSEIEYRKELLKGV